ncbi:hypothetical protein Cgig2_001558 [Carnegiea gigantea]|uniref:Uncharacterized protein n=1 Tax=Carnegiea gigantea TaxID=171969 RepID=A0A9Q1QB73_9CARY|nr:hypothetical protein Cgig2_001558 [Carnegiea gigantea]
MEVSSRPFLSTGRLPIRITNRLPLVPIGHISPTRFSAHEREVVLLVSNLGLLLNCRYEALLIIETIAPEVPGLAGSPLDCIDLCKRVASTVASASGSTNLYPAGKSTAFPELLLSPSEEELVLVASTSASMLDLWELEEERGLPSEKLVETPQPSSHLDLGHPAFLKVKHTVNCHMNFPGLNNILHNAKDATSRRILITGRRGSVGLMNWHDIGDFLWFPKQILGGNVCDHPAIN